MPEVTLSKESIKDLAREIVHLQRVQQDRRCKPRTVSINKAADILDCSRWTIRRRIEHGELDRGGRGVTVASIEAYNAMRRD